MAYTNDDDLEIIIPEIRNEVEPVDGSENQRSSESVASEVVILSDEDIDIQQ